MNHFAQTFERERQQLEFLQEKAIADLKKKRARVVRKASSHLKNMEEGLTEPQNQSDSLQKDHLEKQEGVFDCIDEFLERRHE